LFYRLIKIAVRRALKIFCRRIEIMNRRQLKTAGPLLIAANHPNSFLDAIIIGAKFEKPVHFLARGDAFNKPWHSKLLRLLNMIPVYRLSEGKENLFLNEEAFARSKEILSANGIVLIFIEGICVHKHQLQSFKKGAARIAIDNRGLAGFKVMPLGIAYNSFESFGKEIHIIIGEPLSVKELLPFEEEAKNMQRFNERLYEEIAKQIDVPENKMEGNKKNKYLFFLPGAAGFLLHLPLYYFLRKIILRKTAGTIFFDSVLFGALLFFYPVYLLLMGALLLMMRLPLLAVVIILIIHPITAWCTVRWRSETGRKREASGSNTVTLSP